MFGTLAAFAVDFAERASAARARIGLPFRLTHPILLIIRIFA